MSTPTFVNVNDVRSKCR